jgi:hypothetical protein
VRLKTGYLSVWPRLFPVNGLPEHAHHVCEAGIMTRPHGNRGERTVKGLAMARRTKKVGGSRRGQEALPEVGRGILTRVNADGLRALKMLAIERDLTLQALAVEALNDVLVKHGKRPVVKNPLL